MHYNFIPTIDSDKPIRMPEESGTVTLPAWLMKKIEERLPRTEFKSPSEYVTYVMTEVVSDQGTDQDKMNPLTDEEEAKVKERLKALGYL